MLMEKAEVFTFPGEKLSFIQVEWLFWLKSQTLRWFVIESLKCFSFQEPLRLFKCKPKKYRKWSLSQTVASHTFSLILPHLCSLLWFTPLTLPVSPFLVVKTSAMGGTPSGTCFCSLSLYLFLAVQRIRILSSAWRPSLTSLHKIVSLVSISSSPQSWHLLSSYHFFSLN